MKKSPLQQTRERFETKAGLVQAVRNLATGDLWLEKVNGDKGWDCVSNRQLLHLHTVLSTVKDRFGSRAKLIEQVATLEKRSADDGYRTRLERYPTPRLLDLLRAAERRAKRAAA